MSLSIDFDFDDDDFTRKVMDAARTQAKELILSVAEEVKNEMGADAEDINYEYDESADGTDEFGTLKITGPEDKIEQFRKRIAERMQS
jgi:hypothetical protein